jgi:diaminopimelate decarboxylase
MSKKVNRNKIKSTRTSTKGSLAYPFQYKKGQMHCEGVNLAEVALEVGTPFFAYSAGRIRSAFAYLQREFADANSILAYSIKALSTRRILETLSKMGSGFDVTSAGELKRALLAGGDPNKIIFAGVGKTDEELELAIKKRIHLFNVESPDEARHINAIANRLKRRASIALRINPGVDAHTHRYITTGKKENKFGIDIENVPGLLGELFRLPNLDVIGLHAHIGSNILLTDRHGAALRKVLMLKNVFEQAGKRLEVINIGGGFGIDYHDPKKVINIKEIAESIIPLIKKNDLRLIVEPGRFIAGPAGALITQVTYVKHGVAKNFAILNAGMNVCLRPSLYEAYHRVEHVKRRPRSKSATYDIVGPICESSDFLGKDRTLPEIRENDLMAVMDTGAYCASMASQYNSHPRPAEILVDKNKWDLIRKRDSFNDMIKNEL